MYWGGGGGGTPNILSMGCGPIQVIPAMEVFKFAVQKAYCKCLKLGRGLGIYECFLVD